MTTNNKTRMDSTTATTTHKPTYATRKSTTKYSSLKETCDDPRAATRSRRLAVPRKRLPRLKRAITMSSQKHPRLISPTLWTSKWQRAQSHSNFNNRPHKQFPPIVRESLHLHESPLMLCPTCCRTATVNTTSTMVSMGIQWLATMSTSR